MDTPLNFRFRIKTRTAQDEVEGSTQNINDLRMPTLHDTLWNLTVDDIRYRLRFLVPGSKVTRKADFVAGLKAALEGPGFQAALNELDAIGRAAVMEAVHDCENRHRPLKFRSKYGRDAVFFVKPENTSRLSSYQTPANSTLLNLFFYYDGIKESPVVPCDLAARLRSLLPEPTDASVACIPEPAEEGEVMVRHTESEALAELGALLRLAAMGQLGFSEKTGIPAKSSLAAIRESLSGGDWFPPEAALIADPKPWDQEIGSIKPIGWTRMLHAAGLITMSGSKSALTVLGRKSLEKPAWEVIKTIWQKWIANKEYDEFNRIDIIKGQSVKGALTAKVARRSAMLEALGKCPAGAWISFDAFSHFMRADGLMFEVSHDPWKLYIADRQYGALGYSGYGGWDVLQDRYMLCFFMEYAAALGILDIAYMPPSDARSVDQWGMDEYSWLSRYDGLQAFRINPLGIYVLSAGNVPFTPARPLVLTRLSILGQRTIRVTAGSLSPAERTQLETWAEPVGENGFRLDASNSIKAIEAGHDLDGFMSFLEERADQPLPETVVSFLRQVRSDGEAVRQAGNAILFECRDTATAEMISKCKELSGICLWAGRTTLAVREESLAKFRKQVRLLGLGVR